VATLNLLNNEFGRWNDRAPLVIDQARALDADVYAFQEVDARGDQVTILRDALGPDYQAIMLANPDPASIKSLAIITRLDHHRVDECTTLEQGDIALRVSLGAFDVTTTHFHFSPTKQGSERRRRQAEQLLTWLGTDGRPSAVMGDFNSRDGGAAITTMKTRFRSAHEVANGREPHATHPTPLVHAVDTEKAFGLPTFPEGDGAAIDFIFVDPRFDVASCRVAWNEPHPDEPNLFPSDHFGLVADLVVP
jgi:endonuclease/exonuclease/phosphatase family metal-dependent hydrolase